MFGCIIGIRLLFLFIFDPCLVNNILRKPNEILTILNACVRSTPLDEILLDQFLTLSIGEELDSVALVSAPLLDGSWGIMVRGAAHRPKSLIVLQLCVEVNTPFFWCVCYHTIQLVFACSIKELFLRNLWASCRRGNTERKCR